MIKILMIIMAIMSLMGGGPRRIEEARAPRVTVKQAEACGIGEAAVWPECGIGDAAVRVPGE